MNRRTTTALICAVLFGFIVAAPRQAFAQDSCVLVATAGRSPIDDSPIILWVQSCSTGGSDGDSTDDENGRTVFPEVRCPTLSGVVPDAMWTDTGEMSEATARQRGMLLTTIYHVWEADCDGEVLRTIYIRDDEDAPSLLGFRNTMQGTLSAGIVVPAPVTNPAESTIVKFPTWLWTTDTWTPHTLTQDAGYLTITLTATAQRTTWQFHQNDLADDLETVVCTGPGTPWDTDRYYAEDASPDCGYTFTYPSRWDASGVFNVTVVTDWQFDWTVDGIAQPTIGTLHRTTNTTIDVDEIQTIGGSGG